MATLGIFTVKRLRYYKNEYYTYGGFGDYLSSIRSYFNKTILVAHVSYEPPDVGYYRIPMDNLQIIHLPTSRNEAENLLHIPFMILKSISSVRRMDVVHARMPDYTGIIGALICRMKKVPFFCQVIADWFLEAKKTKITKKNGLGLALKADYYIYDILERLACRGQLVFAQGITCFEKHKNNSNCNLIVSSAHRIRDIAMSGRKFKKKPYRILNVARLTGIKNQELILKVLAYLNTHSEDWKVSFVGAGPKELELRKMSIRLGVSSSVNFVGQLDHGNALWEYYDNSDVFVLSSRSEGTPKVLLEAMARGLPVVASKVGGVPTIVKHEIRGLMFEDNNQHSLMESLLRLSEDYDLQKRLKEEGLKYAKIHCVENEIGYMMDKVFAKWPFIKNEIITC